MYDRECLSGTVLVVESMDLPNVTVDQVMRFAERIGAIVPDPNTNLKLYFVQFSGEGSGNVYSPQGLEWQLRLAKTSYFTGHTHKVILGVGGTTEKPRVTFTGLLLPQVGDKTSTRPDRIYMDVERTERKNSPTGIHRKPVRIAVKLRKIESVAWE